MHPVQEDEGEKTYLKYRPFTFLFINNEICQFSFEHMSPRSNIGLVIAKGILTSMAKNYLNFYQA